MRNKINILVATGYSKDTHKSGIHEFWRKEMGEINDVDIVMRHEINFSENLNRFEKDSSIFLVPIQSKKHLISKIFLHIIFYLRFFFILRKLIREKDYDVFHSYNFLLGALFF